MSSHYRNARDETSISRMVSFFTDMTHEESVHAKIYDPTVSNKGVSHETLSRVNNQLSGASCWSKVSDWDMSVEYTVQHPDCEILISDSKSCDNASILKKNSILEWGATCDDNCMVKVEREKRVECPHISMNVTRFSNVKVRNTKIFQYEKPMSSWIYRLCVSWEGKTLEDAKNSGKTYELSIESGSSIKARKDPKYTSASFMEKILDVSSVPGKTRMCLTFV